MIVATGGPVQQTEQTTQPVIVIEQPPKEWAVEILSGIVVAVVVAGILAMWRRK